MEEKVKTNVSEEELKKVVGGEETDVISIMSCSHCRDFYEWAGDFKNQQCICPFCFRPVSFVRYK